MSLNKKINISIEEICSQLGISESKLIKFLETSDDEFVNLTKAQRLELIDSLTKEMKAAAKLLEFEHAAFLRDKITKLKDRK